jgi:hypothetical protein
MTLELAMVTIDCVDPRRLAGFWTEALGGASCSMVCVKMCKSVLGMVG